MNVSNGCEILRRETQASSYSHGSLKTIAIFTGDPCGASITPKKTLSGTDRAAPLDAAKIIFCAEPRGIFKSVISEKSPEDSGNKWRIKTIDKDHRYISTFYFPLNFLPSPRFYSSPPPVYKRFLAADSWKKNVHLFIQWDCWYISLCQWGKPNVLLFSLQVKGFSLLKDSMDQEKKK